MVQSKKTAGAQAPRRATWIVGGVVVVAAAGFVAFRVMCGMAFMVRTAIAAPVVVRRNVLPPGDECGREVFDGLVPLPGWDPEICARARRNARR